MEDVTNSPGRLQGGGSGHRDATEKDDLVMVEWAECRTTIGRIDTALEDLRKYGFTLVTGLLTASGLVGSATSSSTASQLVPAAGLVVMVLVLGLFALDLLRRQAPSLRVVRFRTVMRGRVQLTLMDGLGRQP